MAGGGAPPPGAPIQAQPAAAGQGTSLCSCNKPPTYLFLLNFVTEMLKCFCNSFPNYKTY